MNQKTYFVPKMELKGYKRHVLCENWDVSLTSMNFLYPRTLLWRSKIYNKLKLCFKIIYFKKTNENI